jgi:hypothetical protein
VALVPDRLLNLRDDAWRAAYDGLVAQDVGLVVLPPPTISAPAAAIAVELALDQIATFADAGYRVIWLQDDDETIVDASVRADCARRGLALPSITRAELAGGFMLG